MKLKLSPTVELTLTMGESVKVGDTIIKLLPKTHPKMKNAQVARMGFSAPPDVAIKRGEIYGKVKG